MRPATGLIVVALGAILAFAVSGHPSFLNVQVVGWVIMLTGVAGMLIPRRGYGWLRRRMVLRRGPGGRPVVSHAEEQRYPAYVMLNPGATEAARTDDPAAPASAVGEPSMRADLPPDETRTVRPNGEQRGAERPTVGWAVAERAVADWETAERAAAPGNPRPAEEVVEEYIEE